MTMGGNATLATRLLAPCVGRRPVRPLNDEPCGCRNKQARQERDRRGATYSGLVSEVAGGRFGSPETLADMEQGVGTREPGSSVKSKRFLLWTLILGACTDAPWLW